MGGIINFHIFIGIITHLLHVLFLQGACGDQGDTSHTLTLHVELQTLHRILQSVRIMNRVSVIIDSVGFAVGIIFFLCKSIRFVKKVKYVL